MVTCPARTALWLLALARAPIDSHALNLAAALLDNARRRN
jgi:hypothetical protein